MDKRDWPGGWNKQGLGWCAEGFLWAQEHQPIPIDHSCASSNLAAYYHGHQLARDLRRDGPLWFIGIHLGTEDADTKLDPRQARAFVWCLFIELRDTRLGPDAPPSD